jgi:hypothetical protein
MSEDRGVDSQSSDVPTSSVWSIWSFFTSTETLASFCLSASCPSPFFESEEPSSVRVMIPLCVGESSMEAELKASNDTD